MLEAEGQKKESKQARGGKKKKKNQQEVPELNLPPTQGFQLT